MSLIDQLRLAARQAAETEIEYGGGDPAELVAMAEHIALRENCLAECIVVPDRPGSLRIRFRRSAGSSDPRQASFHPADAAGDC